MYHQRHCLECSGWTAHQRVTVLQVTSPSLPGWAEVLYYKYTYLRGLLIALVVYTSCAALVLQSVELQRSIDDVAVRDSMLESAI